LNWVVAALLLTFGLGVGLVSTAAAATTIGSTLELPPMGGDSCPFTAAPCTTLNTTIEGRQISSPRDGVVVRWRIRADANGASTAVRLRVLDHRFAATSTGPSEEVTGSGDHVYVFGTRQPIKFGDRVALDFPASPSLSANSFVSTAGNEFCSWPSLADGLGPQTYQCGEGGGEFLYNADIEPDSDCDGLGDETQDRVVGGGCLPRKLARPNSGKRVRAKRGAIWLSFACDPAGGDCGDALALFAVGRSGKLLRHHRRIALTNFFVPAGSTERVRVQLTLGAWRLLRRTGEIGARLQVLQAKQIVTVRLRIRLRS
jgi:hypothetical protein